MISEKIKAPDFKVNDQNEHSVSLSDFKGKKVILYFYPKDNTPGCTKEACSFRDNHNDLSKLNAVVLGVSPDSGKSHTNFISKFSLPFTLLSDPDHNLAETFGAWGEKKMYGKTYEGIIRSTVIIDEKGIVEKTFPKVKAAEHGKEVLDYLRSLI